MMQLLLHCNEIKLKLCKVDAGGARTETFSRGFWQLMITDATDGKQMIMIIWSNLLPASQFIRYKCMYRQLAEADLK